MTEPFYKAGSDYRWNPFGLMSRLQNRLSFQSNTQPCSLILWPFPPGFKLYVPVWKGRYLDFRFGWHWDKTNKAYIFGAACKIVPLENLSLY